MQLELSGKIVRGTIQTDRPVEMPDASLVTVILMSREESSQCSSPVAVEDAASLERRRAVFKEWMRRNKEQPINSGGWRFNRDELYERD